MNNIKKIILWILLISWMAIIFLFSNQSGEISEGVSNGVLSIFSNLIPFELGPYFIRKVAHFLEFMILGILFVLLFKEYKALDKKQILYCILLCILYACSDELHQMFVAGRSPKVFDVLIDTFGSMSGIYFVYLIIYNRLK